MFKGHYRTIRLLFLTFVSDPKFFFKQTFIVLKSILTPLPGPLVIKEINGVKFEFDFDYSSHLKEFYFGTYEPKIVMAIKNFVKEGDTFIDVGANIGYITAVASGCVGKSGSVHSFEPIFEYSQRIKKIAELNKDRKIIVNTCAAGEDDGKIKIYVSGEDIGSSTAIPREDGIKKIIEVPVCRLDNYIIKNNINNLKMIKIDVESFEFPVLKGLENYFIKCCADNSFPLVLCEIHPEVAFGGVSDRHSEKNNIKRIFAYMEKFSYYPFDIMKVEKRVTIREVEKEPLINVIFRFCK